MHLALIDSDLDFSVVSYEVQGTMSQSLLRPIQIIIASAHMRSLGVQDILYYRLIFSKVKAGLVLQLDR